MAIVLVQIGLIKAILASIDVKKLHLKPIRFQIKSIIMLSKFTVKGFKQFEHLTMDLTQVRDYDFNTHCLTRGKKNRLLKSMLVYGPNASGKSNLGFAVFDIVQHLFDKISLPEAYNAYLNADLGLDAAEFCYEFLFSGTKISYRYKKTDFKRLVAEEFSCDGKLLFSWDSKSNKADFTHLGDFGFATLNQAYWDKDTSFLRYVANNSALKASSPVKKVMDFVGSMLWFRRADSGNSFIGLLSKVDDIGQYIINQGLLKDFEKFLNENDVDEKLISKETADGREAIFFNHKRLLPFFSSASSGTMALAILFYWKDYFDKVSFIFIDDFDAFYHTKIAKKVFDSLSHLKKQVLLTTSNTNLLDHRLTRPDCCFELRAGELKSLADRTTRILRRGNNLEKLYLAGEFFL